MDGLICPQCKHSLHDRLVDIICDRCAMRWQIKDGISVLSNKPEHIYCNEIADDEIKQVLRVAESDSWSVALYEYVKKRVEKGDTVTEDQRIADWRYLLPLHRDSYALVLGSGWGTVPIALAETCGRVYAIDSTWEKIAFVNARRKQQGIDNLYPVYMKGVSSLPFPEKFFDLITMVDFQRHATRSVRFREIVRYLYCLLKEGGRIYFSVDNRLAFQHLFRLVKANATLPIHTIYGYRHILQEEGFSEIRFYAPLPHYDGIPLFYLPLESSEALNYFFQNIFPLFEMVSPEVKKQYGFQYKLAKIGVRLTLIFRLTNLAKFLVPGFSIIATK